MYALISPSGELQSDGTGIRRHFDDTPLVDPSVLREYFNKTHFSFYGDARDKLTE